eukprot:3129340-Prymnesium_polylepis.2
MRWASLRSSTRGRRQCVSRRSQSSCRNPAPGSSCPPLAPPSAPCGVPLLHRVENSSWHGVLARVEAVAFWKLCALLLHDDVEPIAFGDTEDLHGRLRQALVRRAGAGPLARRDVLLRARHRQRRLRQVGRRERRLCLEASSSVCAVGGSVCPETSKTGGHETLCDAARGGVRSSQ